MTIFKGKGVDAVKRESDFNKKKIQFKHEIKLQEIRRKVIHEVIIEEVLPFLSSYDDDIIKSLVGVLQEKYNLYDCECEE